jgi:hypothetical protein
MSRNRQRHWASAHAPEELKTMLKNQPKQREVNVIKGRQKNRAVITLTCPAGCKKGDNILTFSRKEHFRRHLLNRCKQVYSEEEVWRLSDEATQKLAWQDAMEGYRLSGSTT